MRRYTGQHRFYAGVDLHARSLFTHVLDDRGQTVFERDLPASPAAFLDAVRPFLVRLAAALAVLPEAQRQAVEMRHLHGRPLADIAREMGRTPAAVAGLLHRGLAQLRSLLEGTDAHD